MMKLLHPEVRRKRIFRGFSSIGKKTPNTELYDIDLIKRDLLNHFYTRKGERIMEPEFGTIIWDLLFEPFDDLTRSKVYSEVQRIIKSDPRVEVAEVRVDENEKGIFVDVSLRFKPYDIVDSLYVIFFREEFGKKPT